MSRQGQYDTKHHKGMKKEARINLITGLAMSSEEYSITNNIDESLATSVSSNYT